MTIDELLEELRIAKSNDGDPEDAHSDADEALLAYINDKRVTAAFRAIRKWYA
jgi:hypothetical protein